MSNRNRSWKSSLGAGVATAFCLMLPAVASVGCGEENKGEEFVEEVQDEVKDARREIEDEIDDRT